MADPSLTDSPASAYDMGHAIEVEHLATFAVLVDNEPGVLHRVVGLFAARGYNIDSLTVAETDPGAGASRITIVTRGTPHVLAQIEAQLKKMVSTRDVQDVTRDPNGVERELALVKVRGVGADRVEAKQIAELYRKRWTIERWFQKLEAVLESEVATLGHPQAALLTFGVAVVAGNALSVVERSVSTARDDELKAKEGSISLHAVAVEVQRAHGGMLIAVEEKTWAKYDGYSAKALVELLLVVAQHASLRILLKKPRSKPKQKRPQRTRAEALKRASTSRLLPTKGAGGKQSP